jgi:hypothetical protein
VLGGVFVSKSFYTPQHQQKAKRALPRLCTDDEVFEVTNELAWTFPVECVTSFWIHRQDDIRQTDHQSVLCRNGLEPKRR